MACRNTACEVLQYFLNRWGRAISVAEPIAKRLSGATWLKWLIILLYFLLPWNLERILEARSPVRVLLSIELPDDAAKD